MILTDLSGSGWVILIIGLMELVAAFSIWTRHAYGRWIGVITAGVSALAIMFTVNAFPFAALNELHLDLLVIYGLGVPGGRERA